MRSIPNVTLVSPADCAETVKTVFAAAEHEGPMYIRLTGAVPAPAMYEEDYDFEIGKAITLRKGSGVTIIAAGSMVHESLEAAKVLEADGLSATVINMYTLKPLDTALIDTAVRSSTLIVTVEEHSRIGGLGGAVAEYKSTLGGAPAQLTIALPDEYGKAGAYRSLQIRPDGRSDRSRDTGDPKKGCRSVAPRHRRVSREEPMIDVYREALAKPLVPIARLLTVAGVAPHAISMSGIVFGSLSAGFFATHQWTIAVVFFALSGLADTFDGMVARARNLQSPFGSFFDNFCSAYTDSAVFGGLIAAGLCNPWWGVAALVGTLTRLLTWRLDGLVPKDEAEALRTRFPSVLFGKGDRIVLVGLGTVLGRIGLAIIVIAIGTNLVAIHRCYHLYKWERAGRRAEPAKSWA